MYHEYLSAFEIPFCFNVSPIHFHLSVFSPTAGRVSGYRSAVSLSCGQDHCLLLSTTGDLYSWGAGGDGQLGVGYITSMIQTPRSRHNNIHNNLVFPGKITPLVS